MKLFLDQSFLGEIPLPGRLFGSNLVYVCPRCSHAWGRIEVVEGVPWYPTAGVCKGCRFTITPRHTPGSFYQYYTDFSREHFEYWIAAIANSSSVLAWEFERALDHAS